MLLFGAFLWVSVSALFLALFGLLHSLFKNSESLAVPFPRGNKHPGFELEDSKDDIFKENESPNLVFKFQYQTQTFEEFKGVPEDAVDNVSLDSVSSTSTNKYEFNSGNGFCCVVERPEEVSFRVLESFSDAKNVCLSEKQITEEGFLSEEDFLSGNSKETAVPDNAGEEAEPKNNLSIEHETFKGFQVLLERDFVVLDSDFESVPSSYEHRSCFISPTGNGFLSDGDFEEDIEHESSGDIEWEKEKLIEKDLEILRQLRAYHENKKSGNEDGESHTNNDNSMQEEVAGNIHRSEVIWDDTKHSSLYHSSVSNSEDLTRLETLWEHQELIDQLKVELKKVRGTGLPTILEESEYPKIMEDLKPWKMDENCHHEDRMGELHKVYKSYRERMRKFDVLSYQKMYPIGFLPSREALRFISSKKSSPTPATTSLLPPNFRQVKRKISEADEMVRYVKDLQSGLEIVYVGQLCVSWEILHWQYEKALEIWESDPYGTRRYNEVAGEFQQFQVLLQRFLENEPFEGPRVQSYVNNRRTGQNLLQVPVLREDSMKDKMKGRRKGGRHENEITSDMLVEIMEESIRIFWRFVRTDKAANVVTQKRRGAQIEPLDPADAELLAEVQKSLQKKDKKIKEVLRGGNCILRKLRKNEEEESSDQVLCFFSQVDVKLVARVLGMSRVTRDHLLWCHSKLGKINFVNRKIHVEPSFLLFPC